MTVAVAIDFGSRVLHLIVGEKSGNTINVNHAQIIPIPAEALGDDLAKRNEALLPLLKDKLKELGIRKGDGAASLSFSRFLLREIEIPNGKPEEIRQMVQQELIHFSNARADDIVEVYQIGGRQPSDGKIAVQGAAMNPAIVESYYSLLTDIGLKPQLLTLHNNALAALLASKPEVNRRSLADRTAVFLDLGMESTLVQIISYGNIVISRSLPIGFAELNRIISTGLGRTLAEADEARTSSFSFDPESPSYHALGSAAQHQLEIFASRLTEELVKILRFYGSSIGRGHPIDTIYPYGTGADVRGLNERFEASTNLKVEKVASLSNLTFAGNSEPHLMLNACGALCLI